MANFDTNSVVIYESKSMISKLDFQKRKNEKERFNKTSRSLWMY